MIEINGEQITNEEATRLIRMLCEDAKKIAGEYHGMKRSAKFRVNWSDEYKFVSANWRTFIVSARAMYAQKLGDPKTKPEDARAMHIALVLQAQMGQGQEADTRLQLAPGTQQFEGDAFENKKIVEKFGVKPNMRATLMNNIATRH
jgi:hypothetical protein